MKKFLPPVHEVDLGELAAINLHGNVALQIGVGMGYPTALCYTFQPLYVAPDKLFRLQLVNSQR